MNMSLLQKAHRLAVNLPDVGVFTPCPREQQPQLHEAHGLQDADQSADDPYGQR